MSPDNIAQGLPGDENEIKRRASEFVIALSKKLDILELSPKNLEFILNNDEILRFNDILKKLCAWAVECARYHPITLEIYEKQAPQEVWETLHNLSLTMHKRVAIMERRQRALQEFTPPFKDAERYLNREEHQQFSRSLPGAVDAYLAKNITLEAKYPGFWLSTPSAAPYCYWTGVIEKRRDADIRKCQVLRDQEERIKIVKYAAINLREKLKSDKKPQLSVLPALEGHQPENWGDLYFPPPEKIARWAEAAILKIIPGELSSLVKWKLFQETKVVPQPIYENLDGIPCLSWHFSALVLVVAELWLDAIMKGNPVGQPVKVDSGSEKLGTLYLGPRKWSVAGVPVTPLALLSLLLTDKKEAPGITVVERDSELTVFAVSGMEEETVDIVDDFRDFIREVAGQHGLGKGLMEAGFIDAYTAELIDSKKELPLPAPTETLGQADISDSDSEVRKTLLDMGYQVQAVDEALSAVSSSSGMSIQQKVAAALEIIHC